MNSPLARTFIFCVRKTCSFTLPCFLCPVLVSTYRENIAIDGDFLHRISSSLDAVYGQHFASEWLKLKVTAWTNPSVHSQLQVYRDSGNVSVGSPKGHYKLAERGLLWLGPAECIH